MNEEIIKKLFELGFTTDHDCLSVATFRYGSDSVKNRGGISWVYYEYTGYNEEADCAIYKTHKFETVEELMELIGKIKPNLIK